MVLTNALTGSQLLAESSPKLCWLFPRPGDPFVHAKLFLIRRGQTWELICGSMNLTDYAMDRMIRRKAYRLEPEGTIYTDGTAQQTGLPLCGFLENVYLQDFDKQMERRAAFYARCGDDILIGARTREEIEALAELARHIAAEKRLSLSEKKTQILEPGEPFLFLGWKIDGGTVDFSDEALQRIGRSIRKASRSLLIRYRKAGVPSVLRLPAAVRQANQSMQRSGIFASFRIVTVPDGLRKIDRMICEAIRTVSTGKNGKAKYRISYEAIRSWGYSSLVNRYYRRLSRQERS